jgi:hypothetical protein
VIPQTQVLTDIAKGNLAQVSCVIPDGAYSDHTLSNDGGSDRPDVVVDAINQVVRSARNKAPL